MKPLIVNDNIYIDNNATTQVDNRVLAEMLPYFSMNYGNANSFHQYGAIAKEAVNMAREQVADLVGAKSNEVVFTSGATESINTAIKGVAISNTLKGKHIVTVETEHPAVLDTCKYLETLGFEVTYLSVQNNGLINLEELESVLRLDTILVSVMYVNNETGIIQPVKEIAEISHNVNALYFSDCTQAVGKLPINIDELGIDLMCFSGHKIYGPKGIGALVVNCNRNQLLINPLIHGGGHEGGIRSGTLNVPGIVGFGKACSLAQHLMEEDSMRIGELRDILEKGLLRLPKCSVNGTPEHRVNNVTNICFSGREANVMLGLIKHVSASNGSACTSATLEPSHVLKSMCLSNEDSFASIRFSLGRFNNDEDIETVLKMFHDYYLRFPI